MYRGNGWVHVRYVNIHIPLIFKWLSCTHVQMSHACQLLHHPATIISYDTVRLSWLGDAIVGMHETSEHEYMTTT